MVDPYRVAAPVPPEPLSCHLTPRGCCRFVPQPSRFPASVGFAAAPRRALPRALANALAISATVFFLAGGASLSALMYTKLSEDAEERALREFAMRTTLRGMIPLARGAYLPLATMGTPTHAVDELWRRAEQVATMGGPLVLSRAALPHSTLDAWNDGSTMRVAHERGSAAGLRVLAVGERSLAGLVGLRQGDLITALNGFPLDTPEDGLRAFAEARQARALVAEVAREGRRVVIRVDWIDP